MKTRFTQRQIAFLDEYVKDYNATQAAIRAGYARTSAYQRGYELVKNEDMQQRLMEHGLMGLDKLAEIAASSKNDIARIRASIALVERAYGRTKA